MYIRSGHPRAFAHKPTQSHSFFPHASPVVFPTQTCRYPFLEPSSLILSLACLLRGRSLTPVVTRIRSLPVEGPKPHIAVEPVAAAAAVVACTRRHPPPNPSYCLSGGRSPAPVVTRCRIRRIACQGAEALHPSSSRAAEAVIACKGAETLHLSLSPGPLPSLLPSPPGRCRHVRQEHDEIE
jgi:hypothetical protein